MAQKSKRNHIVEVALPLFLEHGFKGTSIDLVVKQSGVSKPTVYNHFPDKVALMLAVVQNWCNTRQPVVGNIKDNQTLDEEIENNWLRHDTVKFYAVVIGEGRRFDEAKRIFWEEFDARWRQSFCDSISTSKTISQAELDLILSQHLLRRLKKL